MVGDGGCCCGTNIVNVRRIKIDGNEVGIVGIYELFKRYYKDGKNPEKVNGEEILKNIGEMNCISENKEDEYKRALMREYKRYCKDKEDGRIPKLLKK
ncbi:hypothetical protein AKJ45_01450 [candidate division MSBL1 archaeon SCGC-AAA261F19]|uniref:Uncharacterized protein n=1 Tax=candidate division MSBL1 archaeon SCGC-AAA261F19 TaxID=1698275 RepID=A0A133VAS4_9EURY|nr:hypothetical protein AKJ45_01450 [candidate division MSBL1 archaeon SCGC-AAA261F19]